MYGEQWNLPHLNASFPGWRWGRNLGELRPLCRKTKLSRDVLFFFSWQNKEKNFTVTVSLAILQRSDRYTEPQACGVVASLEKTRGWRLSDKSKSCWNNRDKNIKKKGKDFWSVHNFLAFIWSKKGWNCQLPFLFFFANYLQRRKTMIKLVWELNVQNDLFSRVMWLQRAWKKNKKKCVD